jgi:hypothetical protein
LKPKFKVGDKVRIRKLTPEECELSPKCNASMRVYFNQEAVIAQVSEVEDCYRIDLDLGQWHWAERWLDPVPDYQFEKSFKDLRWW